MAIEEQNKLLVMCNDKIMELLRQHPDPRASELDGLMAEALGCLADHVRAQTQAESVPIVQDMVKQARDKAAMDVLDWCAGLIEKEIKCIPPSEASARHALERVVERVREGK